MWFDRVNRQFRFHPRRHAVKTGARIIAQVISTNVMGSNGHGRFLDPNTAGVPAK